MNLIKTSFLNGIAVFIRMLSLLGINKLLALYIGPSGYAIVGQFQNAIQMITTFGSGAINTGVTRYTAEYNNENQKKYLEQIWRTAGTFSVLGAVITAILVVIFRSKLSMYFLKQDGFEDVFIYFALGLVFFVLNTLLLAILNGKKEIQKYVTANITGSLLSVLLTFILSYYLGLRGTLISLGTYQSIAFFSTLYICHKCSWFHFSHFFGEIHQESLKKLLKYTLMALASSIFIPLSQILIRDYLGKTLGLDYAGYWEAMSRLGSAYLLFLTSTLTVYYLPRISEINDKLELRREILVFFKLVIPITIFGSLMIYLLRDLVIGLLFSNDFLLMRDLFLLQLMGDTVKVGSWLLGFVVIARGLVKTYIFSELIFSFLYYFLVILFLPGFGFKGVAIAYLLNYVGHFIFMFVALKKLKVI